MSVNFFKAVVQQVLLFGVETLVVTPRMEREMNAFIHGNTTHVSTPNSITCWTTALKKFPDTLLFSPSLLRIRCSIPQLYHAFPRFPATAGQSSSPAVRILPRYLKLGIVFSFSL